MSANGNRKPPRPRIEMVYPAPGPGGKAPADEDVTAAIVAALEQFLADTAPPPAAAKPQASPWQRAALEEGIAARQVTGYAWGHAPRR